MADKKPHELWAEVIRDIGLLLFVFGPLDTIIKPLKDREPDDWIVATIIASLGLLFVALGVELECGDEEHADPSPVGGVRTGIGMDDLEGKTGKGGSPPKPR